MPPISYDKDKRVKKHCCKTDIDSNGKIVWITVKEFMEQAKK
jgi:hypothetical protein